MRRIILIAAVLTLAFAPVPKPKSRSVVGDLPSLQGQWSRVSIVINGKPTGERPHSVQPTIKGDVLAFGPTSDSWKLTLNVAQRPWRITAKRLDGTSTFLGIYKLEADTLTICWRQDVPETSRPIDFDPKLPDAWLCVYKRKK